MSVNPTHDYAVSLLRYVVEEPFNGATDWNTLAAFESKWDASQYAACLEKVNPDREFPYVVRDVGTSHRPAGDPDYQTLEV